MPNVTRYSQGWKNTPEKLAIWICFILTTDQNLNMGIDINYKVLPGYAYSWKETF